MRDERTSSMPRVVVARAVPRCAAQTMRMLTRRTVHLPREHLGLQLRFADGRQAPVFRETVAERGPTLEPCLRVVEFRLRFVRGWGHAVFRRESLLNTPLFLGFPGFVPTLRLADPTRGRYRGVYEWDGPGRAAFYARCLWRILGTGLRAGFDPLHRPAWHSPRRSVARTGLAARSAGGEH